MARTPSNFVSLREARPHLFDGDLLLFRRRRWTAGWLVGVAGRGEYSHAAKVAWWGNEPFCCEVREWYGGRAVTLASQVKRYPGRIDLFRVNPANRWPEYDRLASVRFMRGLAGCDYGYTSVVRAALLHLPMVRLVVRASDEDHARHQRPPFCSQAVAMADRIAGGVDPVPHLADRLTEPCDLAQSPFYQYQFTLSAL